MNKLFVAARQEQQAKQAAGLLTSRGGGAKADKDNHDFQASDSPPPNEHKPRLRFNNQPPHIRHQPRTFCAGMR